MLLFVDAMNPSWSNTEEIPDQRRNHTGDGKVRKKNAGGERSKVRNVCGPHERRGVELKVENGWELKLKTGGTQKLKTGGTQS